MLSLRFHLLKAFDLASLLNNDASGRQRCTVTFFVAFLYYKTCLAFNKPGYGCMEYGLHRIGKLSWKSLFLYNELLIIHTDLWNMEQYYHILRRFKRDFSAQSYISGLDGSSWNFMGAVKLFYCQSHPAHDYPIHYFYAPVWMILQREEWIPNFGNETPHSSLR